MPSPRLYHCIGGLALMSAMSAACDQAGLQQPLPNPPSPAALVIVAGNHQTSALGYQLAESLAVRATDAQGTGLSSVPVTWRVLTGAGFFMREPVTNAPVSQVSSPTGNDGIVRVGFSPAVLGQSTVSATAGDLAPVTFTVTADVLVIWLTSDGFVPVESADASLPLGTRIVWQLGWYGPQSARIASRSIPEQGEAFDSGLLPAHATFEFTPDAVGTWEYVDQVSGRTDQFRVVPPTPAIRAPVPDISGSWTWSRVEILTLPPFVAEEIFEIAPEGPITRLRCEGAGTMELVQTGPAFGGSVMVETNACVTGNGYRFQPPAMASPASLAVTGVIQGNGTAFQINPEFGTCPFHGVIANAGSRIKATGRCIVPGDPRSPLPFPPPPLGTSKTISWEALRQ